MAGASGEHGGSQTNNQAILSYAPEGDCDASMALLSSTARATDDYSCSLVVWAVGLTFDM